MPEPLFQFCNVTKDFESGLLPWSKRTLRAVDDVSLDLKPGETFGIVGESGSGKSTLLRIALRLVRPSSGRVLFEGREIGSLNGRDLRTMRRRMQAVFQDPASSFNPRQSVGRILLTPLEVHQIGTASVRPSLVVADEPTSALDVSVQAQILNLFKQTKRELGLTYLFVSHNLGVIRYVSDRVAVMRLGKIVEFGRADDVFTNPQHQYTQALLAAVPDVDVTRRQAAE
jgi:peptide/nickel transport system ATP-binding protein